MKTTRKSVVLSIQPMLEVTSVHSPSEAPVMPFRVRLENDNTVEYQCGRTQAYAQQKTHVEHHRDEINISGAGVAVAPIFETTSRIEQ